MLTNCAHWSHWESSAGEEQTFLINAYKIIIKSAILFFDIFIDYAITVVPFPPPHSTPSCPPPPSHIPPLSFMSMGHTYKFCGFYISYTILTLPLSIFHLSSMLLILCTFPPLSPSHYPIDNPPCDLHHYGSVPVLFVCLVFFCFCFRCGR